MKATKLILALLFLLVPLAQTQAETVVFDNWNKGGVSSWPKQLTMFELSEPTYVFYIDTYHWNNGKGSTGHEFGAFIKLTNIDSTKEYGPWKVELKSGTGGAQNVHWVARPNTKLPVGIYILRDSDPATRSYNNASKNVGFAKVVSGEAGTIITKISSSKGGGRSEWSSNFDKMHLVQKGREISGHYDYAGGKIIGTFEGAALKGWWAEEDDAKNCGPNNAWSGPFILDFSSDGNSFSGKYGKCANGHKTFESIPADNSNTWHGNRTSGSIHF